MKFIFTVLLCLMPSLGGVVVSQDQNDSVTGKQWPEYIEEVKVREGTIFVACYLTRSYAQFYCDTFYSWKQRNFEADTQTEVEVMKRRYEGLACPENCPEDFRKARKDFLEAQSKTEQLEQLKRLKICIASYGIDEEYLRELVTPICNQCGVIVGGEYKKEGKNTDAMKAVYVKDVYKKIVQNLDAIDRENGFFSK